MLQRDGEDEAGWLMQGIGAVAADTCGFGAIYFDDAWDYLDATHLFPLTTAGEGGLSLEGRGAQYLFLRWLVDVYGVEILAELVQSSLVGLDNVEAAVRTMGGQGNIDEIILQWQVAMLTSNVSKTSGDPLMPEDVWPPYADPEFIEAPTEPPASPSPGTYYGANGYQCGLNFGGSNLYMEGGTTAEPHENSALRVTLGNSDHATYVSNYEFDGLMAGPYSASVVRLAEPPHDATLLNIESTGAIYGTVIRWNDPTFDDIAVEEIYSSSITNAVSLPALPDDGTPIYGVGKIGGVWQIAVLDSEGASIDRDFYDTDRWRIDLQDRAMGSPVRLQIWLDRRYENTSGDVAPFDPWFAVAPEEWVPTPNETDTTRASCTESGAVDFGYPTSILSYLFYQQILSGTPIEQVVIEGGDPTINPCGEALGETGEEPSCINDWDSDELLDIYEPMPDNFYEQVLVQMCTLDPELVDDGAYGVTWFDRDTRDENEEASKDMLLNGGGAAADSGEEAFIDITLEGGRTYLLVVGAGADQGTYELTLREIPG